MIQITPELYQITRGANAFILKSGTDELTVVDTGMPGTTGKIIQAVESLGHKPDAIKHILVTHADFDHAGSLAGLSQATGATVYAGEQSKTHIENASAPPHLPAVMAPLAGFFQKLTQKPTRVDQQLHDRQVLDIAGGIEAIAIPGHTPDNYGFYWREPQILFAADLLNRMGGTLSLTPSAITWNMEIARKSARHVLDLDLRYICVGHGDYLDVTKQPNAVEKLRAELHA